MNKTFLKHLLGIVLAIGGLGLFLAARVYLKTGVPQELVEELGKALFLLGLLEMGLSLIIERVLRDEFAEARARAIEEVHHDQVTAIQGQLDTLGIRTDVSTEHFLKAFSELSGKLDELLRLQGMEVKEIVAERRAKHRVEERTLSRELGEPLPPYDPGDPPPSKATPN